VIRAILAAAVAGTILVPALLLYRTPKMALALARVVYGNPSTSGE
jgi:hypothetical protein